MGFAEHLAKIVDKALENAESNLEAERLEKFDAGAAFAERTFPATCTEFEDAASRGERSYIINLWEDVLEIDPYLEGYSAKIIDLLDEEGFEFEIDDSSYEQEENYWGERPKTKVYYTRDIEVVW